jgi:hypothetical protein
LERFRENQKVDKRRPLSIISSMVYPMHNAQR